MLGLRYLSCCCCCCWFLCLACFLADQICNQFVLKLMGSALRSIKEQYAKPGQTPISSCFPRGSKLTSVFNLFRVFWVLNEVLGVRLAVSQSPTTSLQEFCFCSFLCFILAVLKVDAALATTDWCVACSWLLHRRVIFHSVALPMSHVAPVVAVHASSRRRDFVSDPLLVAMAAHPCFFVRLFSGAMFVLQPLDDFFWPSSLFLISSRRKCGSLCY